MSGIELVIKIPERIYYGVEKGITVNGSKASQILIDAVANATPLPKGHGDLIDKSLLYPDSDYDDGLFYAVSIGQINGTATIIEADTESEV